MALIDMLERAQGGQFFAAAGEAAGVSAGDAEAAIRALGPAIAEALRRRLQDEEAYDRLLDIVEDGDDDFLDHPEAAQDAEAIADGRAILKDVYGTEAKALALGKSLSPGMADASLRKLMAISACAVLAAFNRSSRAPMGLTGVQTAAGDAGAGGGLLGTILSAVVEGVVQGATRSLERKFAPRRRRYGTRKKRKTTRRRTTRPSLEAIFGELLGLGRK